MNGVDDYEIRGKEKVPLFQSGTRPRPYVEPQKPKKPSLIKRMIRAVIGA